MFKERVSAASIAPEAFKPAVDVKDKEDDLVYDLGNMSAFDTHPVHSKTLQEDKESYLKSSSRDNVQLLVNRIFTLPNERDALVGPVVLLPKAETAIPREKHVPEEKVLTKWEKFAKEKGIKNKKKDRKVYDEERKDFVPAFGYKSKSDMSDWLVPVKDGEDPYQDPFTAAKLKKEKNVVNNKMSQLKNIDRASKGGKGKGNKNKETPTNSLPFSIPEVVTKKGRDGDKKGGDKVKFGKGKEGTKKMIDSVSVSTASMGKFDSVSKGEGERAKIASKRRRFEDNLGNVKNEKSRDMNVLASLIGGEEGGKIRKMSSQNEATNDRPKKKQRKL